MMMPFDFGYLVWMLPAFILAAVASFVTKSTFKRYARVAARSGMTGAQAAHHLLRSQGVNDVGIEAVRGFLSDHYDPSNKTLRLSPEVYGSRSLSAIGVACHEAGHALQHAHGYGPLALRTALVPVTQFGSHASYFIILGGMLLGSIGLMKLGVWLFAAVVLFAIVTLPVEWNASARAKELMVSTGIVGHEEARDAGAVLNAAFMTYVAAAVSAIMTLLYYLLRVGLLGGRND